VRDDAVEPVSARPFLFPQASSRTARARALVGLASIDVMEADPPDFERLRLQAGGRSHYAEVRAVFGGSAASPRW
jgi:hypothetical protein